MFFKASVLQILLASSCMASTSLGEAKDGEVVLLQDAQDTKAPEFEVQLNVSLYSPGTDDVNDDGVVPVPITLEQRDPRHGINHHHKNSTDDSGAGTVGASLSLPIGLGLAVIAAYY
ncbi:hypothetical protein GGR52DRAFT_207460 [Hypoxylon sp. FL1284]|nr:hypothetical protein GGR52DRAFT_207460 [Hypoxylon sp. FL1284]